MARAARKPWRPALWAGAALSLVLLAWWLVAPQTRLEVRRQGHPEPLLCLTAALGQEMTLWFFHSYDRAPFEEHYRLAADGLVLERLVFKSCLNGQGFEGGAYRALAQGWAEASQLDQHRPRLELRLGSPDLANHHLILGQRRYRLLDYAQAGDMLEIQIVNQPRWRVLWQQARPGAAQAAQSGPPPKEGI